jgi:mRNA interferase RelE/StbE
VSYRLTYTNCAVRDLEALAPKIRERVGATLLRLSEDPLRHAEKLSHPALGSYRFRIGDYRVIFAPPPSSIVALSHPSSIVYRPSSMVRSSSFVVSPRSSTVLC